ncbi:hypothetical protein ACS0TY_036548 [Phlomoides rotata]
MQKVNESSLKFEGCIPVECQGSGHSRRGGLCILWKAGVRADLVSFSTNHIAINISEQENNRLWLYTGVYGWPDKHLRTNTFQLLRRLAPRDDTPWLCMGDLNEILWSWEKQGGNHHITQNMEDFRQTITDLNIQDLGSTGNDFTWTNGRSGQNNIQVRLDRALATSSWSLWFPEARVTHLPRYKSDHSPILVECEGQKVQRGARKRKKQKLFRFKKMWLEKEACGDIVARGWDQGNTQITFPERTKSCGDYLRAWDEITFGNISKKIKKLKKELESLQDQIQSEETLQLMGEKTKELDVLLKDEEILWFQRSRALWLKDGDRNTSFFHKKASQRRRRNTIHKILNESGHWIVKEEEIEEYMRGYFMQLFTSVEPINMHRVVDTVEPRDQRQWNIDMVHSMFEEEEAMQILGIPLSLRPIEDRRFWNHTKSGQFTVRSAYFLATNRFSACGRGLPSTSSAATPWKVIWAMGVSPRVRHFLWRACNDALPSLQALRRRGIQLDPTCPACGEEVESLSHILLRCSVAVHSWGRSPIHLDINGTDPLEFKPVLWSIMKTLPAYGVSLFAMLAWNLWKARNRRYFDHVVQIPDQIVSWATDAAAEIQPTRRKRNGVDVLSSLIIDDITDLVSNLDIHEFSFVGREANRVAHFLSHYGPFVGFDTVWDTVPPLNCIGLLEENVRREPIDLG